MAEITDQLTPALQALLRSLDTAGTRRLLRHVVKSLRRSQMRRIARQHNPDGSRFTPRSIDTKRKDQAKGPMFRRIRRAANLKTSVGTNEGIVFFRSRVERVARIHHYGGYAAPRPGMRPVQYPRRTLLGFSRQDEREILESIKRVLLK